MKLRTSLPALMLAVLLLLGLTPAPAAHAATVTYSRFQPVYFAQPGTVIRLQPAPAASQPAPLPQPAPAPAVQPAPAPSTAAGPQIVGSASFRARVEKALQLLQIKAPAYWDIVRNNLLTIREDRASGAVVQTGTFLVGAATAASDPYWLASVIVHDAYHVQQYREGRQYYGQAAEAEALAIQRQALVAMGAPAYWISYADRVAATQWWTVPYAQRGW